MAGNIVRVISPESAAQEHRKTIEDAQTARIQELADALQRERVDFEVERDDRDEAQQLRDFRGRAVDELHRQLAEAATREAKGRKALFDN